MGHLRAALSQPPSASLPAHWAEQLVSTQLTVDVWAMPHGSLSVMLSPHAEMHAGEPAQLQSHEMTAAHAEL